MTIAKFERLTAASGLKMISRRCRRVMGFDFAGRIPLARELFIDLVSCFLAKE
jgi:hypothetical protein